MLLEDDKEYNGNSSPGQIQKEVEKLDQPLDSVKLLERVVQWLREWVAEKFLYLSFEISSDQHRALRIE